MNRDLAKNIRNSNSLRERIAGLIINLNNIYKIKTIHANAPTSTYDDENIERFYEYIETALELYKGHYCLIIGIYIIT